MESGRRIVVDQTHENENEMTDKTCQYILATRGPGEGMCQYMLRYKGTRGRGGGSPGGGR